MLDVLRVFAHMTLQEMFSLANHVRINEVKDLSPLCYQDEHVMKAEQMPNSG